MLSSGSGWRNPARKVLQTVLKRPNFQLDRDLDALLQEFNKPTEPEYQKLPVFHYTWTTCFKQP